MWLIKLLEKVVDGFFSFLWQKQPECLKVSDTCIIAHRGAHNKKKHIIENTDAAFANALDLGCWGIEFDVRATADDVLVVNHDPTLERIWGKKIAISELTFAQLRQLVPEILSLAEVVARYGKRLHLFIELKAPFDAEKSLYNDLQPLTPCVDYHLISLKEPIFASLTLFCSKAMLLVAVHNNVTQFINLCLQKKYGGVLGHYLLLSASKIQRLQAAQKQVGVGMVDSKFGLYRELNRGLEWIFSNNVKVLARSLDELQQFN